MLPSLYIARHAETAWTISGQHAGLTDLPLTECGQNNACHLGNALPGGPSLTSSPVHCSERAALVMLAGFAGQAEVDRDLLEWNYGEYESLRTTEIHAMRPG